jgi:hypothetical protein
MGRSVQTQGRRLAVDLADSGAGRPCCSRAAFSYYLAPVERPVLHPGQGFRVVAHLQVPIWKQQRIALVDGAVSRAPQLSELDPVLLVVQVDMVVQDGDPRPVQQGPVSFSRGMPALMVW